MGIKKIGEPLLALLSIAAIIGGVIILLALPYNGFFWDREGEATLGVLLLAGGLTRFWMKSRFYRKD
jgi:hypothetical protein